MPNKKGGKKYKKNKNVATSRELLFKEDEQDYALITKVLGNRRFLVKLQSTEKEVLGKVCGRMKNREWCRRDDWVLVNVRGYEEGKVDIMLKYKPDEVRKLVSYSEIKLSIATSSTAGTAECTCGKCNPDNVMCDIFTNKFADEEVDDL